MSRRLAWKTREAARAAADPELVIRLQSAKVEATKIDPLDELREREGAALALGMKLDAAKPLAGGVPGTTALVAEAIALVKAQAADAVRRRRRVLEYREKKAEELRRRGYGGDGGGWRSQDQPARVEVLRAFFGAPSAPSLPEADPAAALALAAIAAGVDAPPPDADAWKSLRDTYRSDIRRHRK